MTVTLVRPVTDLPDKDPTIYAGLIPLVILLIYAILIGYILLSTLGGITLMVAGAVHVLSLLCLASGFLVIQPNTAIAFVFFGSYAGSYKEEGFWYTNPLYNISRVSTKVVNSASSRIKVNDALGSPIEVECVVSWQVNNIKKSLFAVENFESYLELQMEAALRQIISDYPYEPQEGCLSLRSDQDAVSKKIQAELQNQLNVAGLRIIDARISHLAYAPEIAQLMLRRQQAQAVVQARELLVAGAVGMVKSTIENLKSDVNLNLNDDDKARLTINMMTVLLSDSGAQPVIALGDNASNEKRRNDSR